MTAVIQRVTEASVTVDGKTVSRIDSGLMLLLGVVRGDTEAEAKKLADKIVHLRIFADDAGKMNRSLIDSGGELLVVSQFTLSASVKKGRRPSFDNAAAPEDAKRLYEYFITLASETVHVRHGVFGADMKVALVNNGPVTFVVDTDTL